MALFDKLKGIAKDVSKTVTAVASSAIRDFSGQSTPTPAPAPVVELELLDEATLDYTLCEEFELQEILDRPGEYEITEYIGFDSVPANVEVPGMIDGKNVVRLAEGFFKDNKAIRYVKLGDGIREIANDTFSNSGIRGIILPETLEKIGARAFQNSDLMRINLPDGITFIGRHCFENCKHLQFAKLPRYKTVYPDYMFKGCHRLLAENTILPDKLEKLGYYACIPCVEIPKTVTTLLYYGCGSILEKQEFAEQRTIPNHIQAVDSSTLKHLHSRKLIVPSGLTILSPTDEKDSYVGDDEEIAVTYSSYISLNYSDYEEIVFEPGSTYSLYKTFDKCKNLVKVYIPESIVDIEDLFGTTEKREVGYTIKGEAIKDEYGRQVYDWDGTAMKTKDQHLSYTSIASNRPANPALTIYCVAGSAAQKYAKENDIACAKWDI